MVCTARMVASYSDNWVLWEDVIDGREPCTCCSAMEIENGIWACKKTGRNWLLLNEPVDINKPHDEGVCTGNCSYHPMNYPELARWKRGIQAGRSWGDLWFEEEQYRLALQSAEQRAAERAAADAALKEQEERDRIAREASAMSRKAERVAVRVGVYRKEKSKKIMQPCKFLYNCQGTPAKPTTRRVTTECWSHEYTDPETGKRIVRHVCDRMHPGEEGWCKEWDGNPYYKPENRFAALESKPANRWDGLRR